MRLHDALGVLEVEASLAPEEQHRAARARYLAQSMRNHPDKRGGDADVFVQIKEAWDAVHATLGEAGLGGAADPEHAIDALAALVPTATGTVAPYAIETAVRACACKGCKQTMGPGTLRFGSMDPLTGSYGRWRHVSASCLKVPSRLHARIAALGAGTDDASADRGEGTKAALLGSDDVVRGVDKLSPEHLDALFEVVNDPDARAKTVEALAAETDPATAEVEATPAAEPVVAADTTAPHAPAGAAPIGHDALKGKTVVLTGMFDLPGASPGLSKGKSDIRRVVERAGGRVTSSVSKKTTHLLIGRLPGSSKIAQAETLNVKVIALPEFLRLVHGAADDEVEAVSMVGIERSRGFGGNAARLEGPPPAKVARVEA